MRRLLPALSLLVLALTLAACPQAEAQPPQAGQLALGLTSDTITVVGPCAAGPTTTAATVGCVAEVTDSASGQTATVTSDLPGTFTARFVRAVTPLEHIRISAKVYGVNRSNERSTTFTAMNGSFNVPDGAAGPPAAGTLTITVTP